MALSARGRIGPDAETLALGVLGWILSDDQRAKRFLTLTGLAPDEIRSRVADPLFLAEAILFLEAFEPDLLACAEAMGREPSILVQARRELER